MIQYLDAENLDFSLRQRAANAAPLVPPKPIHLRRPTNPKDSNQDGGSTTAAANTSANVDEPNPSGYSELDVQVTQALFMVSKKMFGEDDDTA